jgi:AICAR transformylase/IMP cyclohydrolase PurH
VPIGDGAAVRVRQARAGATWAGTLQAHSVRLLSTGGTAKALRDAGLEEQYVTERRH